MKKTLTLMLCLLMVLGMLCACNGNSNETEPETSATVPPEEENVLKVLTIGHSLAVDCGHMLALVADAEGYDGLQVGTLYYSGCSLEFHVKFMKQNSPVYSLYLSSTDKPNEPPIIMSSVTMQQAITYDYWDIFVMQGGVFEIGADLTYKNGNIQKIQEFVNQNKLDPDATFAWHMPWATPIDNELRDMYSEDDNPYYREYARYYNKRNKFYEAITKCVKENILTDETFEFMIPSGTALENALSSYLEEKDIHRDYAHASNFSRVIASYTWYCKLAGIDKLDELKLDVVPKQFLRGDAANADWTLTQHEKDLILESVNNALAEPLKMTQSQYTVAP